MSEMLQIGYFSSASGPQSGAVVHAILKTGRKNNLRDGITGFLVAAGDRYFQAIEGPEQPVHNLYDRILKDNRHIAIAKFLQRDVTERSFESWSLAFRRPLAAGEHDNFPELLRALTVNVADNQLRRQIAYFAQTAIETYTAERRFGNAPIPATECRERHTGASLSAAQTTQAELKAWKVGQYR